MIDLSYESVFIFLSLSFVLTVFSYLLVSGLFANVTVNTSESRFGPMVIAYKSQVGPYKKAGELFTDSYCLLPGRQQIGIYYDDPEAVPDSELRYAVGPILSNGETEQPDKEEMELMRSHGFKIFHIPKANFVVNATFPFRTTLSIFIAIYRVYPKLRQYIAERNLCAYPAIEIYTDKDIVFLMPLSMQEEYFVAEFQEEDISVATTEMGSVIGDREGALKDDDVFLKPRTPVRMNNIRASLDSLDVSVDDDHSEQDEINPSESEGEHSAATTSSFDDLTNDLSEKERPN